MNPDLLVNLVIGVAGGAAVSAVLGFVRDIRKEWLLNKWQYLKDTLIVKTVIRHVIVDALFLGFGFGLHTLLQFVLSTYLQNNVSSLFFDLLKWTSLTFIIVISAAFIVGDLIPLISVLLRVRNSKAKRIE